MVCLLSELETACQKKKPDDELVKRRDELREQWKNFLVKQIKTGNDKTELPGIRDDKAIGPLRRASRIYRKDE